MTPSHPMTHSTTPLRSAAALLGLTVLLSSACAADRVVNPIFGAGCDGGTLRRGTTRSALNEDSCVLSYHPYTEDPSAYIGYDARLDAGKAYMLTMLAVPDAERAGRDGLDPLLMVTGRAAGGISMPLAVSDDDADVDSGSELFFVAPHSGSYRVVAGSYYNPIDYDELGGFTLRFLECPVLTLRPDTGTTTFDLRESECRRSGISSSTPHITGYNFVRVKAAPNERLTISTVASDFTPVWHAFGPGMDTFDELNQGFWGSVADTTARTFTFGRDGGHLTIAVTGQRPTGPSRRFQLRLRRVAGTPEQQQ